MARLDGAGRGDSYRAIAKKAGVTSSYVQTILPLAFLAPAYAGTARWPATAPRRADGPNAPGYTGRLGPATAYILTRPSASGDRRLAPTAVVKPPLSIVRRRTASFCRVSSWGWLTGVTPPSSAAQRPRAKRPDSAKVAYMEPVSGVSQSPKCADVRDLGASARRRSRRRTGW